MNIWFEKLAGAAAAESALSMVQVIAFDYEGDGIEMHLTGELELGCTPMGSRLLGAVKINKTDSFVADMSAEGTTFECDPTASPLLDIKADVEVAKIPILFITMENLAFRVKIYHDDGNATADDATDANSTDAADALPDFDDAQAPSPSPASASEPGPGVFDTSQAAGLGGGSGSGSGRRVETQFEGTIMLDEALLSKFPNLPGLDTASIFAAGQFTVSHSAGFSLDTLKAGG